MVPGNGDLTRRMILPCDCVDEENFNHTSGELDPSTEWHCELPENPTKEEFLNLRCEQEPPPGLVAITPIILGTCPQVYYDNCKACLYAAFRRQFLKVVKPVLPVMEMFNAFKQKFFKNTLVPLLEKHFRYNYNAWYNHLNAKQQKELEKVDLTKLGTLFYTTMCKRELQASRPRPKTRSVSQPNPEHKYVMGPLVYALENFAKRHVPGYVSGLNWKEKENKMNRDREDGFTFNFDGDYSAWDLCQITVTMLAKEIYKWLVETGRIDHVPEEDFVKQISHELIKVVMTLMKGGKKHTFGYAKRKNSVYSGSADTTFANTLENLMIQMFILFELLKLDEARIGTAGDDFNNSIKPVISKTEIIKAYEFTATTLRQGEHGLGLTLKFLKFGPLESSDFCSTETFWCEGCQSYKIVRQLTKFINSMQWSHTALQLSTEQLEVYMTAIYDANLQWMKGLPIFTQINDWYNFENRNYKILNGPKKRILDVPEEFQFLMDKRTVYEDVLLNFDRKANYKVMERISEKKDCCVKSFYEVLETRYGLSRGMVDQICVELKERNKAYLSIPSLVEALDFREKYVFPEVIT